jgi:hypothetical protein
MRTLSMRIVTYLIKYLGKLIFFKTILDYESGDQMGSFDVKNSPSKISCLGACKAALEASFSSAGIHKHFVGAEIHGFDF